MSDNWITDRVPTETDGDADGQVLARMGLLGRHNLADAYLLANIYMHWSSIKPGTPWLRTRYWQPSAPPAELSLSDFKVGQTWRTRKGKMCKIISITSPSDDSFPIGSDLYGSHWHFPNGRSSLSFGQDHEDDLIELLSEELVEEAPEPAAEQPAQPAAEIPEPIRTGAAPFYVLIVSDDSGKGGDGNPISWETQIPEGSSLEAVLQQQTRVGHRYGTSYIASCRIIPQLTREVSTNAG